MPPSPSFKQACLTYPEAVRAFADPNLREDVTDACARLGQQLTTLTERFEGMSQEVHSIDMQKLGPPLRPRWEALSKDVGELLWQYRSNAGYISGRLKLFCDSVLPVSARNINGRSRWSYQETVQCLQSFMTISAEHAAITRALVERVVALVQQMVICHTDIAKLVTYRQSGSGPKEVYDLATKLSELAGSFRQVCLLVMAEDLNHIKQAYDGLEVKRSEFAHAQYTVQIRIQQTDCLAITQTKIASLVCDTMLAMESALSLSQSIWVRLKTDCGLIAQWLNSANPADAPPVLSEYRECGPALYATLAVALNSCVESIDPSKVKAATDS